MTADSKSIFSNHTAGMHGGNLRDTISSFGHHPTRNTTTRHQRQNSVITVGTTCDMESRVAEAATQAFSQFS